MSKGNKKMFNTSISQEELENANEIRQAVESAVKEVNPKVDFTMVLCYWIRAVPAEA